MPDELHHYEVSSEHWRVVAEYIGEGYSGDYDDQDPNDKPLMRYDFFRKGEEEATDSYCTLMPTTNPGAVRAMAHLFLNALGDSTYFPKREMEMLTWTAPEVAAAWANKEGIDVEGPRLLECGHTDVECDGFCIVLPHKPE